MSAVWLIRLGQLANQMKFWTAIVGYNPRDRSLSQSIYLVYAGVFFSLWGFAVLTLLADLGAGLLSLFEGLAPSVAATYVIIFVLFCDTTLRGYKAGKYSPFVFSEEDAGLLCQTPVDRRQVAIAWMLGDWLPAALFYLALAVVLCFANLQLVGQGAILWNRLPSYWLAAIRIASIVLPLHLAFIAADYAFGAFRLRDDRDYHILRWIPIGLMIILSSLAFISLPGLQIVLWPVIFVLNSGFGNGSWLAGICVSTALSMVSLLLLYMVSTRLNLSRAAQESHFRWAYHQISWLGDTRLSQQMKTREQLGTGHSTSRLPGSAGNGALIWKDGVTSLRRIDFAPIGAWLGIFGSGMGMMMAPDWGTRMWAFIIWCLLVGQRGTERLRSDLEVYAIIRSLPFSGKKVLLAEIALPAFTATMLTWFASMIGFWLGLSAQIILVVLAPTAILCIMLAAMVDILRHSSSSDLMAGQAAEMGAGGLLLGILAAGLPLGMVILVSSQLNNGIIQWASILSGMILSLGITYGTYNLAVNQYKKIS